MALCKYHPDRPGVGVCMRCRAVICAACCTRLEGINHCHACLKALAARPVRRRRRGAMPLAVLVLGLTTVAHFATGSHFPGVLFGAPARSGARSCIDMPYAPKVSATQ